MKFIVCLSIFLCESKFNLRMTSINCYGGLKTVPQKHWCQIKNIKRQSFLTIKVNLSRPVENVKIDVQSFYKNSDGFKQILEFKNIEACNIIRSANFDSLLIPQMIKDIATFLKKSINGNIFDVCDKVIGEIYFYNLSFNGLVMLNFFPSGEYKLNLLFHDGVDEKILTGVGYGRIIKT